MHNKLIVGSMTAALLFGGAFQSTADASASTANAQNSSNQHKVYYSMNGSGMGELSSGKFQEYVKQYFPQVTWNWESQNSNNEQEKQEKPEQEQEQSEPEQQPESNKPESNQEQSDNNTPSEPQQNEATEQVTEQQEEQPARTPEAQTPQQPAEQKEQQQKPSQSQQLNEFEQQVVELTNQERTAQGLEPLKVDTELSKVAREKSRDMAANNYFSHDSPNYGSPFDMMKQFGIAYQTAGENIARGQRTPQQVVDGWMNSEGHRENIMNPNFTHIGVGYVEQGNHWTQQFIGK
ncbi:CAP domain-containing protein [Lentibacillus juripiscarius]|uniref:CAP domain-containing protein n=1 Tax=Lentibacillus juripiscarius TaxID=257446 RepID=A0ABW5V6A4_9BACI